MAVNDYEYRDRLCNRLVMRSYTPGGKGSAEVFVDHPCFGKTQYRRKGEKQWLCITCSQPRLKEQDLEIKL